MPIFAVLACILSISVHDASAITTIDLKDKTSCEAAPLSGTWISANTTCRINGLTLNSGDSLIEDNSTNPLIVLTNIGILSNGGTFINNGTFNNELGVINNTGIITNNPSSNITNSGTIYNFGTITNSVINYFVEGNPNPTPNFISNSGSIYNSGVLGNGGGTIINSPGGIITNNVGGTIDNSFDPSDHNTYKGFINNYGIINNSGAISNEATFTIYSNGTITNYSTGTITNALSFVNYGTINNLSGGTFITTQNIFTGFGGSTYNGGVITNFGNIYIDPGVPSPQRFASGINNVGIINNKGTINLYSSSSIENAGTINNLLGGIINPKEDSNVYNDGIINNYCGAIFSGPQNGHPVNFIACPTISINDLSLTEGNSGTKNFNFTVTRAGNTTGASSVNFTTVDGTATISDSDYIANSGKVNFAAGQTTKTITILVNGDTKVEPDETFFVNLSGCVGCSISDNQGMGTIQNDDSPPIIYMKDTAVTDGYGTYSLRPINAEFVSPSSILVGKSINTMILHLKKTGNPTGTATIGIFNPDLSVKKLFATLVAPSLSTTYSDYTFSLPSGQSYTLQSGDRVGIKYSGGDKLNFVQVTADRNNGFDGTNSYFTFYTNTWGSLTTYDLTMTLEFNITSPPPTIYMKDTAVTDGIGTYSLRPINAENVTGTSSLVGDHLDTIILHLRKGGSPTGTATIGVFNQGDLSVKELFATLNVTTLTSSYGDYTFSLPSSSPYYLIQAGDIIGIKYTGGDSSNYVQVTADRNNGFDGTNSYYIFYTTLWHWGALPASDLTMTLELVNSTRVAPPIIYMKDTAVTDGYGTYSLRPINAENVTSSSSLVGDHLDTIILHLRKGGSPTGTATVGVFNPDLSVKQVFSTINVSTVSTSYADYTFSLPSSQTYTIQSGDKIGIKYTGGDSSNYIQPTADRNNGFDGTNSYYTFYTTLWGWGSLLGSDLTMTLEKTH